MYFLSVKKIINLKDNKNIRLVVYLEIFWVILIEKRIIFFFFIFRYLVLILGLEIGSNEE